MNKSLVNITARLCTVSLGLWATALPLPYPAFSKSNAEINQVMKRVTVLIQGPDTGSGVLIRQEGATYTVLTARHVIETPGNYEVVTTAGKNYAVERQSIRKLPGLDMAVLKFKASEPQAIASLGDSNTLQEGVPVYVAGFPGRGSVINELAYNFTAGQLTAQSAKPQPDGYALVYTNKTLSGMSGGPVFNQNAQLIGIHGRADGQSQNLEKLNARVFVKTGFNLGIPINRFVSASGAVAPQGQTLASRTGLEGSGSSTAPNQGTARKPAPRPAQSTAQGGSRPIAALPSSGTSAGSGDFFLNAMNQYRQGNLGEALISSTQSLRLNPRFAAAYALRGNIHYIRQDYDEALEDFNQALRLDGQLASAYIGRGLTQSALMDGQSAIADYTQAIQLSPDALAYYNRGVVQLNLGNRQAALEDLRKSADIALAENNQPEYDRAREAIKIANRDCQQSIRTICDR
ncbi:MAG: tetratricopeptide repeat-containing serine protease family protein [Thermosynechococcaceae cyanobacterium MS004]|nr:tetratricopeptide repeat-containing serine protease family protein [Thermosynechococcaceae cyanobacterium MS004]